MPFIPQPIERFLLDACIQNGLELDEPQLRLILECAEDAALRNLIEGQNDEPEEQPEA